MKRFVKLRNTIMFLLKMLVVLTLTTSFLGVWKTYYSEANISGSGNIIILLVYVGVFVIFATLYDGFKVGINRVHELVYSLTLASVFTNTLSYLILCLVARQMQNPIPIIVLLIAQVIMLTAFMYCLSHVYFRLYKARKVLAIFEPHTKNDIIKKIQIIRERFVLNRGITTDRSLDEIKAEIDKHESILICDFDPTLKTEILKYSYSRNKRIYYLPSSADTILNGSYPVQVFDTPVLFLHSGGLSLEQRIFKRTMDIVLSLIGVIILSPFMLITAIAIKLNDGGPVIFKQKRITRDQKEFYIYKFRSMKVAKDDEVKKTTVDDDRVTLVGKIIRPLRIDETPQIFNILFGDMSIVGPRPEMIELVEDYSKMLPEFNLRHKVKAGLTGYAQIYGKYNTTPQNKLNMDLYYIEHYSILEDIKLIAMTLKILFMRESTEGFTESDSRLKNKEGEKK